MIKNTDIFCRIIFVNLMIVSVLFISSCSKRTLNEDDFAKIYAEMVIAQDTALYANNNFKLIQDAIFKKYGISRLEYSETIESYNKDPQKWEKFFDKAISYIEALKKEKQASQLIKPK